MRSKIQLFFMIAALGVLAAGCRKGGSSTDPMGEATFIQLTVSTQAGATRVADAAGMAQEVAIDPEKGLKVAVFNADGTFDTAKELTLKSTAPGLYTSDPIRVVTGDKYFFVFANDGGGLITLPTDGTMTQFIQTGITTKNPGETTTELGILNEDNTANTHFLLGTSWAEKKTVQRGGTESDPKPVDLSIGYLAAMVNLKSVDYQNADNYGEGQFSAPKDGDNYRLGSMPFGIYTVGNHDMEKNPPVGADNKGILVTSAAHDLHVADHYKIYSGWAEAGTLKYTTENTTALQDGAQFYGNTTYVQIRSVYTPAPSETYNLNLEPDQNIDESGTFWTAHVAEKDEVSEDLRGKDLIFNAYPDDEELFSNVREYTNGLTYHKFAVVNPNEDDAVMKNRILRNHYYEITVAKFNAIGLNKATVEPGEKLGSDSMVDIAVTVQD